MNKKSIVVGVIVFFSIIFVIVFFSLRVLQDNNMQNSSKVSKSSLYKIDNYDNTHVYVDTNAKVVTFEGYSRIGDFLSGTALAKKEGEDKNLIIDNNGDVIVPNNKYDYISSALSMFDSLSMNLNYIAKKEDKYALLNSKGDEVTSFEYDEISNWMNETNVYKIEKNDKYGVISNTGKVLIEPIYEKNSIKIYSSSEEKMFVVKVDDKCFVYDVESFDLILQFNAKEIITDLHSYIFSEDKKTLYLFKDKKLKTTKENIDFGSQIRYINNINSDYYFCYYDKNGKIVVYNYDGVKITDNKTQVISGNDFIFAEEQGNVYVYEKDKLIKTLSNYSIEESGIINGDFVVLKNSNKLYNIFNKRGELKTQVDYASLESEDNYRDKYKLTGNYLKQGLYSLIDTKTNKYIAMFPDGQIIDTGNLIYLSLCYDQNKDEYLDDVLIAQNKEKNEFCVINKNGDIIYNNVSYNELVENELYSDLNYINIHDKSTGKYCIYDYKNKKKIIESDSSIKYIKDYKIFKSNDKVYSLDGKMIYEKTKNN